MRDNEDAVKKIREMLLHFLGVFVLLLWCDLLFGVKIGKHLLNQALIMVVLIHYYYSHLRILRLERTVRGPMEEVPVPHFEKEVGDGELKPAEHTFQENAYDPWANLDE